MVSLKNTKNAWFRIKDKAEWQVSKIAEKTQRQKAPCGENYRRLSTSLSCIYVNSSYHQLLVSAAKLKIFLQSRNSW